MKPLSVILLFFASLIASSSILHANSERPLTPFERISSQQGELKIDVTDADANDLITRILDRSGLQYSFIRSPEERLLSIKTKAQATLVLETVAFAAGFNIHKNGNYWVIHPLPLEENIIE